MVGGNPLAIVAQEHGNHVLLSPWSALSPANLVGDSESTECNCNSHIAGWHGELVKIINRHRGSIGCSNSDLVNGIAFVRFWLNFNNIAHVAGILAYSKATILGFGFGNIVQLLREFGSDCHIGSWHSENVSVSAILVFVSSCGFTINRERIELVAFGRSSSDGDLVTSLSTGWVCYNSTILNAVGNCYVVEHVASNNEGVVTWVESEGVNTCLGEVEIWRVLIKRNIGAKIIGSDPVHAIGLCAKPSESGLATCLMILHDFELAGGCHALAGGNPLAIGALGHVNHVLLSPWSALSPAHLVGVAVDGEVHSSCASVFALTSNGNGSIAWLGIVAELNIVVGAQCESIVTILHHYCGSDSRAGILLIGNRLNHSVGQWSTSLELTTHLHSIGSFGHCKGVGRHLTHIGGFIAINVNITAHTGPIGLQTRNLSRATIDGLLGLEIGFLNVVASIRSNSNSHRLARIGSRLVDGNSAIGNAALHSNRTGIDR